MRKSLLTLLLIITSSLSHAWAQTPLDELSDEILSKMSSFYQSGLDEKLYLQFDKPYYSSGDKVWFKGFLRNAITHAPTELSNFIYVELINGDDKLVSRVKVKRDSTGFNGYLTLNPEMEDGSYTIRGYSRWMQNQDEDFFFSRSIKIISPIPETANLNSVQTSRREKRKADKAALETVDPQVEYSVQFFAEGGALLANNLQFITFKAIGSDGLSIDVSGKIYSSSDEEVCEFASTYKGMGSVALSTVQGEQYYAITHNAEGEERRFELPAVEEVGAAINARVTGSRLIYQVKTTPQTNIEGSYFVIHSHGRIIHVGNASSGSAKIIAMDKLFEGINVISLVSSGGNVISERLIFKCPDVSPTMDVASSKENYGRREKASISINVLDSEGNPTSGEFGVAVTDNSAITFNSEDENILSYLLLTSDLKGYVESPGQYFTDDTAKAELNLDLLMLTQGWRRFDLEKILAEELPTHEISHEEGAMISGHLTLSKKDTHKPEIAVMCPAANFIDTYTLTSNEFKLIGLDMPDSAIYVIQSKSRRGSVAPDVTVDIETFPEPISTIAPRAEQAYVPIAFVNQSQDQFFYDGGMELINMDAVYVTASISDDVNERSTISTNRADLEAYAGMPLSMLIKRYPSMEITDEGVFYQDYTDPARFIVDGMDMEYEDVSFLSGSDFEKIEFFNPFDAAMYSDSSGGVFVIELHQDAGSNVTPGIAFVANLGYQKPTALYQPAYEVDDNKANLPPDYRTTIFWDGSLSPDEDGNIEFDFYTADKATTYTITVEGVTAAGEICRTTSVISRTADR